MALGTSLAIAPLLGRLYDIIIDNRFCSWFNPNPEQAAQAGQGCQLQTFALFLLICYAKENSKNLFVGFLDFEKAFDFVNRAEVISDLMKKNCGKNLTEAIAKMFATSTYFPKLEGNRLGTGIETDYGVTQGRRSSGSIFTFYVSDMPNALKNLPTDDFMDPHNLAQLADDTAVLAEKTKNLSKKFKNVLSYSDDKYQSPNISKTLYCNFAAEPSFEPIVIDENTVINSVDKEKGYKYLGSTFIPTDDIALIIQKNIKKRLGNTAKFYSWLNVNETTPIQVKLMVLDSCMFSALIHGVECWGDIAFIEQQLIDIETKSLKAIMRVKKGTTNDLVYHELRRGTITSKIRDRQFKFFQKLTQLTEDQAMIAAIIKLCRNTSMMAYYRNLNDKNEERDIRERELRLQESENSLSKYYSDFNFDQKSCIYTCMMNDHYRYILTRWRLSNHDLKIETGRYLRPKPPREDRICTRCNIMEDEYHVVFVCPVYESLRERYRSLLECDNIATFLDPKFDDIRDTASFLHEIEELRKGSN